VKHILGSSELVQGGTHDSRISCADEVFSGGVKKGEPGGHGDSFASVVTPELWRELEAGVEACEISQLNVLEVDVAWTELRRCRPGRKRQGVIYNGKEKFASILYGN
jgi:hypothetical protein